MAEVIEKKPPKSMKTAFIRVTLHNETAAGPIDYTYEQIVERTTGLADRYNGTKYAMILHDKDFDKLTKEPSKLHAHIVFKFKSPVPFKYVKEVFPFGSIQTANSFNATIQYLIHKNDLDKAQYDQHEVKTNLDDAQFEDYMTMTDSSASMSRAAVDRIIQRIDQGEIKEYNINNFVDSVTLARNGSVFERAFKNYYYKIEKTRNCNVYFILGSPGSGKTSIAKMMAEKMGDGSYCISSSSNDPCQDYRGENTLIFDDLRDDDFEKMQDLLKIIDPHTASSIKSRFRNKFFTGSNIIITTVQPLKKWYSWNEEDKGQLVRRIGEMIEVTPKTLTTYRPLFSSKNNNFQMVKQTEVRNPIWEYLKEKEAASYSAPSVIDILNIDDIPF